VNLPKLSVILTACVAVALSLSACVSPVKVVDAPVPKTEPLGTLEPSDPLDGWVKWTAEPKGEVQAEYNESINVFSEELGLGVVFEQPADFYAEEGWSGVAQYGSLCIISLAIDEQTAVDGSVETWLWSRYDTVPAAQIAWTPDYEAIRAIIMSYTEWCETGGPVPLPDGVELPLQDQPVSA